MRFAICEDNPNMQQNLSDAIKDWASARKVQVDVICYLTAEAFVMAWPDNTFDIAFLDGELLLLFRVFRCCYMKV